MSGAAVLAGVATAAVLVCGLILPAADWLADAMCEWWDRNHI